MIRKVQRTWTGIPGFPQYIISDTADVRRVMGASGAQIGRDLKRVLAKQKIDENGIRQNYYQVTLSKDGMSYTRSLRKLLALSFSKHRGSIHELKIRNNSGFLVTREKTRLITESINLDTDDISVDNVRWNFPKRGERHYNHKLNNDIIRLIRNNLDLKVDELVSRYGRFGVTYQTIQAVMRGKSWRVRTEPFATMTHSGENYDG